MTTFFRVVLTASLSIVGPLMTFAPPQGLSVDMNGSFVERVHCKGITHDAHELRAGSSSGA